MADPRIPTRNLLKPLTPLAPSVVGLIIVPGERGKMVASHLGRVALLNIVIIANISVNQSRLY